jgi:hypothetical protein
MIPTRSSGADAGSGAFCNNSAFRRFSTSKPRPTMFPSASIVNQTTLGVWSSPRDVLQILAGLNSALTTLATLMATPRIVKILHFVARHFRVDQRGQMSADFRNLDGVPLNDDPIHTAKDTTLSIKPRHSSAAAYRSASTSS